MAASLPAAPKPTAFPRGSIKLREYMAAVHRVVAPRGMTREQLLLPEVWSIVGCDLNRFDIIEIVAADGSYFARHLVVQQGRGYGSTVELSFTSLPATITTQEGLPANHSIEYLGPERGFVVTRLSDSVVLREGFKTRDEALKFLLDHGTLREARK